MEPAIELKDLRVDYGDFTAVNNLSLTIERTSIFGLVGPNGAGKTSTLNVLATLLTPTHGTVRMAGFDLEDNPDGIRARLGYMPDLAPIITNLKVWEFLDLYAQSYGLRGSKKSSRVDECLHLVGMNGKRFVPCGSLSRGMIQRVVLAKTLLHKPEILLLDEPASGMDPIARIELKDAMQAVSRAGATIIISSHILSELAEMATSIGFLHQGRLRHSGSVQEVLSTLERTTTMLEVDVLGDRQPCADWLKTKGLTLTLDDKHSQRLRVELEGGAREQANLLTSLIQGGYEINGFHPIRSSLEDLMRSISADSLDL